MLYVPLWHRLTVIQVLKFFVALTNFGEKVLHNWMLSGLQKLRGRLYANMTIGSPKSTCKICREPQAPFMKVIVSIINYL